MKPPITYPAGHPIVSWDNIRRGVLAREWTEHTIAWVIWAGTSHERQEYPECIEPETPAPAQVVEHMPAPTSTRRHKQVAREAQSLWEAIA